MSNDNAGGQSQGGRGEGSSAPSPAAQEKTRTRRAARKRTRTQPPQLQFVVATNPDQFKDADTKRSVRSQAMIQYRYKSDGQKSKANKGKGKESGTAAEASKAVKTSIGPEMALARIQHQEGDQFYSSTSAAWRATNPNLSDSNDLDWHAPSQLALRIPPPSYGYRRALSYALRNPSLERVTDHEETDVSEANMMAMVQAELDRMSLMRFGAGVDPFLAFPQFASPELNSVTLVRTSVRTFVSSATMEKWLPSMMVHPHILLSATTLGSSWLDMHAGCSGDTRRTVLLKGEVIGWINQRLRNTAQQFEDLTLMVILHLLVGEMWSCNEKTLRIHESGVVRLIAHRGGMEKLGGNGAMAEVAASSCLHADVLCEATPFPLFQNWQPSKLRPLTDADAIPESPLFCPRDEFFTLAREPNCSPITYNLLSDMRDLTNLFIAHHDTTAAVYDLEAGEYAASSSPSPRQYDAKVQEIRERLASLPSAHTPGLPTSSDWEYESCRIASLIYASAIIMRVPLSVAAASGPSIIFDNERPLIQTGYGCDNESAAQSQCLVKLLYETLERSNTEDIWGDMAGVLYWVSLVGAAAGRNVVSLNMSMEPTRPRAEAYATWVRRCFIMFATRAMIILIFQHPLPIVLAQKKMLKVQELLRTGDVSFVESP